MEGRKNRIAKGCYTYGVKERSEGGREKGGGGRDRVNRWEEGRWAVKEQGKK